MARTVTRPRAITRSAEARSLEPNWAELPCLTATSASILIGVYRARDVPVRATLQADTPLLLAGLKRLAEQVGIEGTPSETDADLAIRCVGAGARHPVLDLCFGDGSVVLTITEEPSPEIWLVLRELLEYLS